MPVLWQPVVLPYTIVPKPSWCSTSMTNWGIPVHIITYMLIYIYQNKHDRLLLKWCCNCKWQFKLKPLTTLQRCWFRRNEEVPSLCFVWESNQTYWNCFQWLLPAQCADHWAMTVSPSVTQWQCCHVLVTRTLSTLVPSCFLTGTHCISVLKCFCHWDS